MRFLTSILIYLLTIALVHAQGQLGPCDPLDPSKCYLPFPNNFWLRTNENGQQRVTLTEDALPIDMNGVKIDPVAGGWNSLDGFSPMMPILTYLGNVSLDNVPHYWNLSRYADIDCPTVLLDTETGQIVPHFAELDFTSGPLSQQTFMIWPAQRLHDSRRYIVGIRNMRLTAGSLAPSSSAFIALRDGIKTHDPNIELRRDLFQGIFKQLSMVGFDRVSLQIAWDFTTGSKQSLTGRIVHMRDDAFKRLDANGGVQYQITQVTDTPTDASISRTVQGFFYIPQYVNQQAPGAHLVIGQDGLPVYQGMGVANFTIRIPHVLANVSTRTSVQLSVLQYGHGLLGSQNEVRGSYLGRQANQYGYVLVAVDWVGLSSPDEPVMIDVFAKNVTNFLTVPDRCHQGMLHALTFMKLMKEGRIFQEPQMKFADGQPLYGPNAPGFYYGNSQGGILGTVYMAVSNQVQRGVLGVTGGSYAVLVLRSRDWDEFGNAIAARYLNSIDRLFIVAWIQLLWDRMEPSAYMSSIVSNTLPNTPPHEVIIHHALGDQQVTYVGAYILGRSIGCTMFQGNQKITEPGEQIWGFDFIPDNAIGHTAMQVTWVFPTIPAVTRHDIPPQAPKNDDTHGWPRQQQTAIDMMAHFFFTGEIINTCHGGCVGTIPSNVQNQYDMDIKELFSS